MQLKLGPTSGGTCPTQQTSIRGGGGQGGRGWGGCAESKGNKRCHGRESGVQVKVTRTGFSFRRGVLEREEECHCPQDQIVPFKSRTKRCAVQSCGPVIVLLCKQSVTGRVKATGLVFGTCNTFLKTSPVALNCLVLEQLSGLVVDSPF